LTIIRYAELTTPEVAELPRDLPLILPLGEGYAESDIAAALGTDRLCILPALPYGWAGSALAVSPEMLRRVVEGLWTGPAEEGFSRRVTVHDGAEDVSVEGVTSLRLRRPDAVPAPTLQATPERVVLIAAGHTEQHGLHLPMSTDTIIIDAIMQGTVQAIPDLAERLPTLPYGVSMFRAAFAGTFSMGGRVFEDFLVEIVDALVRRGADRFYLNSGHGGNGSFMHNAVKYAGDRHPGIFCATSFLHTSGSIGAAAIEKLRTSPTGGMGHAGELETSYMLHLRPDLCRMDRVVDEIDFVATPDYYMDWIEGGALIASPPWQDDTATGSYGAGSHASAEKGRAWLETAIAEKIGYVREIHEQQNRRIARRIERGIDYGHIYQATQRD
jgi:creatinine amidohydrolase